MADRDLAKLAHEDREGKFGYVYAVSGPGKFLNSSEWFLNEVSYSFKTAIFLSERLWHNLKVLGFCRYEIKSS